jgi:hypothetical protein
VNVLRAVWHGGRPYDSRLFAGAESTYLGTKVLVTVLGSRLHGAKGKGAACLSIWVGRWITSRLLLLALAGCGTTGLDKVHSWAT